MGFNLPVMNRLRRSGRALSPASLFATGAQGVIYDPRDLSTMFQDSLGTTPVTAPGQVVGLRLDKSKNGIGTNGLSRRNLLAWSEVLNEGTVWVVDNSGATNPVVTANFGTAPDGTNTADRLQMDKTGGLFTRIAQTVSIPSSIYTGSVWMKNNAAGTANVGLRVSATGVNCAVTGAWQRFSVSVPAAETTATFQILLFDSIAGNDETADILVWGAQLELGTTVSTYQRITSDWVATIPGNHATQATAGARLTYGIEPKTGTRNLLTYTEDFSNAYWSKFRCTISTNSIAAPDGSLTADKMVQVAGQTSIGLVGTQGASVFTAPASSPVVLSIYAKAAEKTFLAIGTDGLGTPFGINSYAFFNLSSGTVGTVPAGLTAAISPVGNGWFRCSISLTTRASSGTVSSIFGSADADNNFTVADNGGIHLWGAQAEFGSVITPYQKVVTAFEVTEAGVPTCHYCAYAGANSMATAAIDFTATDKMSVFAGVRKVSTGPGILIELSSDSLTNNGAFGLFAPSGFGGDYYYNSRGTVSAPFTTGTGTYVPPINNIVTAISDISGDLGAIRVNGIQVAQTTNNQGTGNYGNYPLYFGRQAGSTLPFTGRDYGIVGVGKATSAAEINITEAWLAANTPTVVL